MWETFFFHYHSFNRFLKWFTTDFLEFQCMHSAEYHTPYCGIRGMIRVWFLMVWPWFGHSSLNLNEHAVWHAVSRMKMPPVPQYASSLFTFNLRRINTSCYVQHGSSSTDVSAYYARIGSVVAGMLKLVCKSIDGDVEGRNNGEKWKETYKYL